MGGGGGDGHGALDHRLRVAPRPGLRRRRGVQQGVALAARRRARHGRGWTLQEGIEIDFIGKFNLTDLGSQARSDTNPNIYLIPLHEIM